MDAAIITAYEELASAPPPPGFSRRAVDGRGLLLREALQQLRAARGAAARAGAPRATAGPRAGLALDPPLLPGALALLAEVGEADVVLAAGVAALSSSPPLPPAARRDVALALAHAHCAAAGKALEEGAAAPGSSHHPVAVACAHLAAARSRLALAPGPPLALRLAADVAAGLADLAPRCALEQLALPLDGAHAAARAAAAALVKHLLALPPAASPPVAGALKLPTPEYAKAALASMTAAEVASAADWRGIASSPSSPPSWLFPGALDAAAAAHIVAGFVGKDPELVAAGEALLGLSRAGASVAPRAAARLLLGDADGAASLLADEATALAHASASRGGVGAASARARAAAADIEFVAAAAPARAADPLPGLVSLAEEWLGRAALPAFRDTAEKPPSNRLGAWFDDRGVAAALDARSGGRGGARAFVARGLATAKAATKGLAALASRGAPPALVLPAVPGAPKGGAAVAAAATAPASRFLPSLTLPPSFARNVAGGALVLAAAGAALAPNKGGVAPTTRAPAPAKPAPRAAVAPAPVRAPIAPAPAKNVAPPTLREAEAAVLRWHAAKADALGPRHSTSTLAAAAADPWRAAVARDAATAQTSGWFWVFNLKSLRVDRVDATRLTPAGGGAVVAHARVREAGDLYARTGKKSAGHSYDNAYAAEYALTRAPGGAGWRVAGVLVTGEPRAR